jgi:hypothetical protein
LLSFLFPGTAHTQWVQTNGPYGGYVYSLAVSGTYLFAGTWGSGIFLSTNNGTSWTPVNAGLTNPRVYTLSASGANLFAGTGGRVFLSSDSGTSWTAVDSGLTSTLVRAFAVSDTNLFAATGGGGVFVSADSGMSWVAANSGLTSPSVLALTVSGTNLFAGTGAGGVLRRPLSEMIIATRETSPYDIPGAYSLRQNYPNPFNPTTTIEFMIPSKSHVSLQIFNVLGRLVTTLVNETLDPGRHTAVWDAHLFASGVYLYRLQAGEYQETKRLVVLR